MRKLFILGAMAMALALPTASRAQVSLGLRLGYAPSGGASMKDAGGEEYKMSDGVKSQIPIQIDALYNVNPNIGAGLYFSYGLGQLNSEGCDVSGVDCSASVLRVGVQGIYTFKVEGAATKFVPWAGLGLGYEKGSSTVEFGGEKYEGSASGFEGNIQLGGDYSVNEKFAIGPYVMLSIGQYSTIESDGTEVEGFDKTLHEWYGFGLRGKFDL